MPRTYTSAVAAFPSNNLSYYFAEKYTQPIDTIDIIKNIRTAIVMTPPGFATIDGSFYAHIVGVSKLDNTDILQDPNMTEGLPNINDIKLTSDPYVITNGVGADGIVFTPNLKRFLDFEFSEDYAIGSEETIYIVIEWRPTSLNGSGFYFTQFNGVQSKTGYAWAEGSYPVAVLDGATVATLNINILFDRAIYCADANPPVEILLPTNCRYVKRIYNSDNDINLTAYPYSQYQYNKNMIPKDRFVVSGRDVTTGSLKVLIFPSKKNISKYNVEFQAYPDKLVNDGDYSIIPGEFRNILKYKSIIQLIATNAGIAVDSDIFEADYLRSLQKLNENFLPYENYEVSVNVGSEVPSDVTSIDYNGNIGGYDINTDPNTWQENKSGTGRGSGG
jgi:hypothetical protein